MRARDIIKLLNNMLARGLELKYTKFFTIHMNYFIVRLEVKVFLPLSMLFLCQVQCLHNIEIFWTTYISKRK